MAETPILKVIVIEVDREAGYATVVLPDNVTTRVYPQDGALPEVGQWIHCVRSGGDLIPIASSQRSTGTVRGAIEADSFIGLSETTADSWNTWTWTPLANTTVAQPTEGVDPLPWMRLTRTGSTGRAQATINIPLPVARRYQAVELSAPAASSTGRDCFVRVDFLFAGGVQTTYLYHLDNLYADERNIQSEPLLPPAFADTMKLTVYSESTTMTAGQFLDLRVRSWTVPVFQGGAVVDLDGNVLADHRGLILNGFPMLDEPRVIPIVEGVSVFDFPPFNSASEYTYKPLGTHCQVNLSIEATGAAPTSTQMRFELPYAARKPSLFVASYLDQGVRRHGGFAHVSGGAVLCSLHHNEAGNNGNVDESNPFTFGNTDQIVVSGMYPIAT